MDDPALRERLRRIERRQYLTLGLLAGPYLYAFADYAGIAVAGVVAAALGVMAFAVVAYRRRTRDAASG